MSHVEVQTAALLDALGHGEEPFGLFYTDNEPETGFAPQKNPPVSREMEAQGGLKDIPFSCFIGNLWLARRKKTAAYISADRMGCVGGGFYTGMYAPYLKFIPNYVSTGIPGFAPRGERYLPSVQAMETFLADVDPRPAPANYLVGKPLSAFTKDEKPEVVAFFARGEVLGALCQLAVFTTGNVHVVAMPFGAGCTNLIGWPLHYLQKGEERAVVGGSDPSCRKFMKVDELTFAVPYSLFEKMLAASPESFLYGETWEGNRKKVVRSRKTWGERLEENGD